MPFEPALAFVLTFWTITTVAWILFRLYRNQKPEVSQSSRPLARCSQRFELSPEAIGGFSYWSLFLVSFLGLFLEMLLIRWVSSEIRIFAYFKNFVLIACFLGFGLGCSLCRQKINFLATLLPLLVLTIIIQLPWRGMRELLRSLSNCLGVVSEVHIWGIPSVPPNFSAPALFLYVLLIVVPLFALLAWIFVPIGQLLGWYLEAAPKGIRGYSVNVLGSLAGILLYTLLCFFYQPPAVWFLIASIATSLLVYRLPSLLWATLGCWLACVGLLLLKDNKEALVAWSPYQKLALTAKTDNHRLIGYQLTTNDSMYQQVINLSDSFVKANPDLLKGIPIEYNAYNVPYLFYPSPSKILVLGAGMGNDVAAALRNGGKEVVAVEIDPLILQLGQQLHFEKPYDSPRVRKVLEDARSYIQNSKDEFDLIVFSLLDSHTTSSHYSNIRIDNYVYTLEAIQAAKGLLRPDGLFIVKFQVDTPWIAGRLHGLLSSVFGTPPLHLQATGDSYTTGGRFFVTGSSSRLQQILANPRVAEFVKESSSQMIEHATLTTDDWPYFYQHEPGVPAGVIVISCALAGLSWHSLRRLGVRATGASSLHFFLLGAAFLLLEVQVISKIALLFGTTWIVNSVVISAILLLIVASNLVVDRWRRFPLRVGYLGLLTSIGVSFMIPIQALFFQSFWIRGLAAAAVFCLPVFFAGMIFIRSFSDAGFRGEALGANLMGALLGGLLESVSFWTGIKFLVLLAGGFYAASYLAFRAQGKILFAKPRAAVHDEDGPIA
jgi:spermidine synthase